MFTVVENESRKNVAQNALEGLKLRKNSVFFGVNGSGKSTVCEILTKYATLNSDSASHEAPYVFTFNSAWRAKTVGDFIEGGTADGVTTVNLGSNAPEIERGIRNAEKQREAALKDKDSKKKELTRAEDKKKGIILKVRDGVRKDLARDCNELSNKRFNRRVIENILEKNSPEILTETELETQLERATVESPGSLPPLTKIPKTWDFSDELWKEITTDNSDSAGALVKINDWIRRGMDTHKIGDSCQFCRGEVTASRMRELKNSLDLINSNASSTVKSELDRCKETAIQLQTFKTSLKNCNFSTSIYSHGLDEMKNRTILTIDPILEALHQAEHCLEQRLKNPWHAIQDERPIISFSSLQKEFKELEDSHRSALTEQEAHSKNKQHAIDALKLHCCSKDGSAWKDAVTALKQAEQEYRSACKTLNDKEKEVKEWKNKISTTAFTADFLNENLSMILGDNTLQISEGSPGEGYRITRHDRRADGMSEGEKKLVALLYFCAEFLTEERKQVLPNSLVLFDDLGSELDESRLLAIDSFIVNHFSRKELGGKAPGGIAYFTHSQTHLKILQNRLGSKAFEQPAKDGKKKPPSSIFYDIYKTILGQEQQSTKCRQWDDEAVTLTNDYWLSFHKVLTAFEDLSQEIPVDVAMGNFCRKVLEGFTEFRFPGNDKFGVRIDSLVRQKGIDLSPSISKLVNESSHTDLSRSGGATTRSQRERSVIQTLKFVKLVDEEHFNALLNKLRNKEEAKHINRELRPYLEC